MSDFARDVCDGIGEIDPPDKTPATLFQGDQLLATGVATVETDRRFGTFWPLGGKRVDIPDRGTTLKLTGTEHAISIKNLYWCGPPHFHFDLA